MKANTLQPFLFLLFTFHNRWTVRTACMALARNWQTFITEIKGYVCLLSMARGSQRWHKHVWFKRSIKSNCEEVKQIQSDKPINALCIKRMQNFSMEIKEVITADLNKDLQFSQQLKRHSSFAKRSRHFYERGVQNCTTYNEWVMALVMVVVRTSYLHDVLFKEKECYYMTCMLMCGFLNQN